MSEPRVIQADFCNWRPVQGRKVLQLILEVPIERTQDVLAKLGVPTSGESKWVAVALLDPEAREPQPEPEGRALGGHARAVALTPERRSEIAAQGADARWGKRKFSELPLSQQAAMRCGDEQFLQFLAARYRFEIIEGEEGAASLVRQICEVTSRNEIQPHTAAATHWNDLESRYQAWRTDQQFSEARR